MTCADTCEGKRSHATTPRIFKLRAEDLRRGVHRFLPGNFILEYLRYKILLYVRHRIYSLLSYFKRMFLHTATINYFNN